VKVHVISNHFIIYYYCYVYEFHSAVRKFKLRICDQLIHGAHVALQTKKVKTENKYTDK
jgi:hypothetical protein